MTNKTAILTYCKCFLSSAQHYLTQLKNTKGVRVDKITSAGDTSINNISAKNALIQETLTDVVFYISTKLFSTDCQSPIDVLSIK